MGFSVTRLGFTHNNNTTNNPSIEVADCLYLNMISDLIHNGFTVFDSMTIDSNGLTSAINHASPKTDIDTNTVDVVLIPDSTVDPLIATNPWCLRLTALDSSSMAVYKIAMANWSPIASTDKPRPTTAFITSATGTTQYPYSGIGISVCAYDPNTSLPYLDSVAVTSATQLVILPPLVGVQSSGAPRMSELNPYGYTLTIVNRGLAAAVFSMNQTESIYYTGAISIQRAVSCGGVTNVTGNTPLYLVTNIAGNSMDSASVELDGIASIRGPQNAWFYQIIRESQVTTPYPSWTIAGKKGQGVTDSTGAGSLQANEISDTNEYLGTYLHRFPSQWNAPVTRDTGEYVLIFPFGMCSNRFAYTDEIDLISVSKANAYQALQAVPVSVYGQDRTYLSLGSNNTQLNNSNGIRIFIYTKGTEITATTTYTDFNPQYVANA